jgi:predicted restriction endonuclease
MNSLSVHKTLNELGYRRPIGEKKEPTYAFEHKVAQDAFLYIKKKDNGFFEKNYLLIHPSNEKYKEKLENIEGLTVSWTPRKSSSYRKFPKFQRKKSRYGFEVTIQNSKALIELISIVSPSSTSSTPGFKSRSKSQFSVVGPREGLEPFAPPLKSNHREIKSYEDNNHDESDITQILQGDTEKASEIMARLGQGTFRKNVSRVWGNKAEVCALSLVNFPALLTASHIVPWKDCTGDREHWRLDGANGILLCAHYDRLFDRHLITFDVKGLSCPIRFSKLISDDIKQTLCLDDSFEVTPNQMKEEDLVRFKKYLEIHNRNFAELEVSR